MGAYFIGIISVMGFLPCWVNLVQYCMWFRFGRWTVSPANLFPAGFKDAKDWMRTA